MQFSLANYCARQVGLGMGFGEFKLLTAPEQVAAHLRAEILTGRLTGLMPGVNHIAKELGIHATTAEAALQLLQKEALLVPQGPGRRRLISSKEPLARPKLEIVIILYSQECRTIHYLIELQHRLTESGFMVKYAPKSLKELNMDVKKVASMVAQINADIWMVHAGSRDVLDWFSRQSRPVIGLFGAFRGLPIAGSGPDKTSAVQTAVRRLIELGHRRIVYLTREERRKPTPGHPEQVFLQELEHHDIRTGSYNLPDWDETAEGFRRCIDSLFGTTPPTALIIATSLLFHAAQQHLAHHGIRPGRDVSLICTDADDTFAWCHPSVAHVRWNSTAWVRKVAHWVEAVASGKYDRAQIFTAAEFVEGGTVALLKKGNEQKP